MSKKNSARRRIQDRSEDSLLYDQRGYAAYAKAAKRRSEYETASSRMITSVDGNVVSEMEATPLFAPVQVA